MAEVLGVAASAITLATLFSSCIECFSYFKAAQNCPSEAETLLVKLDCEKARLLVWGNTVGILQTDSRNRYSQLGDSSHDHLIRRCIAQIISLLTDASSLQAEYGGRTTNDQESQRYLAVLSVNSMNIFQSAKRTFFARTGAQHTTPSLLSRVKWAIRDASRFRILLLNLKDFVDNLIQLVPVPADTISSVVEEDIVSTVNISTLQLIADSCDDDSYPQWSARATEVIRDSQIGTMDRRNIIEVLRDTNGAEGVNETMSRQEPQTPVKCMSGKAIDEVDATVVQYNHNELSKSFVVLTEECLSVGTGNGHCDGSKIGPVVVGNPNRQTLFSTSSSCPWNLGRRLLSNVNLSHDLKEKLTQREATRLETMRINFELPSVEPICRVYVHCGACACAINTARALVEGDGVPEHVDMAIRIDDRIPTSCRRFDSAIDILTSIRSQIEENENISTRTSRSLGAIDCPALEKRIFVLEQEHFGETGQEPTLQQIIAEDYGGKSPSNLEIAGIIFIVEADFGNDSLERHPFRSRPRKPRANEIYALRGEYSIQGWLWDRHFIGRFSKSKFAMEKEKEKALLNTSQGSISSDTSSRSMPDSITTPRKRQRLDASTE